MLTNEEILSGFLVDGLVNWRVLLSVHGGSSTDRMKRIQARIHANGLVHLLEAFLLLHEVEIPEDNSGIGLHSRLDFHGIVLEVL